jgi:hypothetical protein
VLHVHAVLTKGRDFINQNRPVRRFYLHGISLAQFPLGYKKPHDESLAMNRICEHCDEEIVGNTYHVTSEYENARLLDMTVCAGCASVAKSLGLRTEEISPIVIHDSVRRNQSKEHEHS